VPSALRSNLGKIPPDPPFTKGGGRSAEYMGAMMRFTSFTGILPRHDLFYQGGEVLCRSVPGIAFGATADKMLYEEVRTDGEDAFATQVNEVEDKVEQATPQQIPDHRVKIRQYGKQCEEVDRVEDAKAYVGNGSLDRLQFFEVPEHPHYAEVAPALDVEKIVIYIDQDGTDGKKHYFLCAKFRCQSHGRYAGQR